jgi:hypothetical protein
VNLTSATQQALLAALRATVPKICRYCKDGDPFAPDEQHSMRIGIVDDECRFVVHREPCLATAERALIALAEKEMENG